MNKHEKPSDFDWVTVRAGCSALNMFRLLKHDAAKNVEAIKTATKSPEGNEMAVRLLDNGSSFVVMRRTYRSEMGVRFTLSQDWIRVESQGVNVSFTATLTLNDEGECRFMVGDKTLDRWQLLRRALEPLFFWSDD
jgi:hypothetical protein